MERINTKMKDIAIYGAGGFGREILCVINAINEGTPTWNFIGYFDDGSEKGSLVSGYPVLGNINDLNLWEEDVHIVIAIANPSVIKKIVEAVSNKKIFFPNIIAPNVFFFNKTLLTVGEGNVITFGGRISCDVVIGSFNLINGACSIGHDVHIGNFNIMQPETRVSGQCLIGDENYFGVRSTVIQGIKIGNSTKIGAGSMVMRNTKDGQSYFGYPAKILKV